MWRAGSLGRRSGSIDRRRRWPSVASTRCGPGFAEAGDAARDAGFAPIVRLAGGHAAAYHEQSLIYEEIVAQRDVTAGLHDRFRDAADLLAGALAGLGVETQVGEIPGEYCPGAYTVSAADRIKLVGSAQRAVRGGALLSAFILVGDGDRLRAVLFDVYRALEIAWQPGTAGALDDVAPGVTMATVQEAVLAARGQDTELIGGHGRRRDAGAGAHARGAPPVALRRVIAAADAQLDRRRGRQQHGQP